MIATLFQIVGIVTVAIGCGLVYPPAGVIILGIGVLLFGLALERSN